MKNLIRSTFTAIALGLLFSTPYAAPIYAAAKFDDALNPMAVAKLPTCNTNNKGSSAAVSDYSGTTAWGVTVGPTAGGGSGTARVFCDGTNWTVFAGIGSGATTTNVVLAAPVTSVSGNYGTGCASSPAAASNVATNHTCMGMDDHWIASSLNVWSSTNTTGPWLNAFFRCNGSTGGSPNCTYMPFGGGPFPAPTFIDPLMTSWGNGGTDGYQSFLGYSFGYGTSQTFTGLTLTHTPLSKNSDGSLRLASKWYFTNPNNNSGGGWCDSRTDISNGLDCNYVQWIGPQISLGGLNTATNGVGNTNAIIPASGGLMQWRMKLDGAGLQNGMYPGIECEAVDTGSTLNGGNTNANMEFGYTHVNGPLQSIGLGINNNGNGIVTVNTGDDGVGNGNLTNWHTYGIEWTGSGTHQFHYYVDGVERTNQENGGTPTINDNQQRPLTNPITVRNPTLGWSCTFSQGASITRYNNFHSEWDVNATNAYVAQGSTDAAALANPQSTPTNGPGPYFMDISDIQVYKKPNT